MEVYIVHKKTGLFWTSQKSWSGRMQDALNFGRVIPATDCCEKENLHDAELLLLFPGSQTGVRVDTLIKERLKTKGLNALIGASVAVAGCSHLSNGTTHWFSSVGTLIDMSLKFA